ncbi:MAG: CHRD domain-containing protein, partial [Gammaproteobacteria bacterium]
MASRHRRLCSVISEGSAAHGGSAGGHAPAARSGGPSAVSPARAALAVLVAFLALVAAPTTARAEYSGTVSGTSATLTGDAAGGVPPDVLIIGKDGPLLAHNRGADPGFAGETDFDSSTAGVQTLSDGPSATVAVNAGAGSDTIAIGGGTGQASSIAANFSLDGGTGVDYVNVNDDEDATGRNVVLTANQVSGFGPNPILHSNIENSSLLGGSGADTFTVSQGAPSASLFGNEGDDTFALQDGVVLYGIVVGGAGNDVLDMSAFSTPVTANLGTDAVLGGYLSGGQEVPPTASDASGYANVYLDRRNGLFDMYVSVTGIAQGNLTASHLHAG